MVFVSRPVNKLCVEERVAPFKYHYLAVLDQKVLTVCACVFLRLCMCVHVCVCACVFVFVVR